jgi:hypothetical protein
MGPGTTCSRVPLEASARRLHNLREARVYGYYASSRRGLSARLAARTHNARTPEHKGNATNHGVWQVNLRLWLPTLSTGET